MSVGICNVVLFAHVKCVGLWKVELHHLVGHLELLGAYFLWRTSIFPLDIEFVLLGRH